MLQYSLPSRARRAAIESRSSRICSLSIATASLDAGIEAHLPVVEERQFDALFRHDAFDGYRAVGDQRIERLHAFVGQRFDHLRRVAAHKGDVGAAVAAGADAEPFHTYGVAHQGVGIGEQFIDRQGFAAGVGGAVAGRYGDRGQQEDEDVFHFHGIGFRPGRSGVRRPSARARVYDTKIAICSRMHKPETQFSGAVAEHLYSGASAFCARCRNRGAVSPHPLRDGRHEKSPIRKGSGICVAGRADYFENPLPMARKSSALRAAPPIRPPSTSSLAKISAAFEGLHEPP